MILDDSALFGNSSVCNGPTFGDGHGSTESQKGHGDVCGKDLQDLALLWPGVETPPQKHANLDGQGGTISYVLKCVQYCK